MSKLDEVLSLLEFPGCEQAPYPSHYKVELPEDVYRSLTYAKPPTQSGVRLAQIQAQKEVDAIEPSAGVRQASRRRPGPVASSSPYDFRPKETPPTWKAFRTFDQSDMQNAVAKSAPQASDVKVVGKTGVFNKKLLTMRTSTRHEMPVTSPVIEDRIEEDPVIQEIAKEAPQASLRVFASARSIAAIVTCTRSVYRFEVEFSKRGNDIYANPTASDESVLYETNLETITVTKLVDRERATNEFAQNRRESTRATAEFINFCKGGSDDQVIGADSTHAFVYRRIIIENVEFIIRCEVDAVVEPIKDGERPKYSLCRVFNDFPNELRVANWAKELETKRGAVMTMEVNANSSKVARWVAMSQLLDAAMCYVGYVVRKNERSVESPHVLLGCEKHSPSSFAQIISLPIKSVYGIMEMVFDRLTGVADGTYVFVRDPKQKKTFTIFSTGE